MSNANFFVLRHYGWHRLVPVAYRWRWGLVDGSWVKLMF
jgi:hypothetical protein